MQELQSAVSAAFSKIAEQGIIQQAIEKHVTETVVSAIKDTLRSYSDFGKQVNEAVSAALKVDFDRLGLPGYNDLVLKLIRKTVENHTDTILKQQLEAQMASLLEPVPETITLSKLVADFIEHEAEDSRYSCSCDGPSQITLIVEESEYGMRWIYLDKDEEKDKHQCAIRFLWNERDEKISALKFDRNDVSKTLFVGLYGFERDLFQMHVAGTKLVLDKEPEYIDTAYPGHND